MTSFSGVERRLTPEASFEKILELIRSHDLVSSTTAVGSDIKTFQASIIDRKLKKHFIGCGKGVGIQSEVSALYEAFEHYISYVAFHDDRKAVQLRVAENRSLTRLIDQQILPTDFIDSIGGADRTVPWLEFHPLGHDQAVYYPLFLAEPRYSQENKFNYDDSEFDNLSYLSNGSGCGSGSTTDEALVHALNEAIERDATSLFLYKGFVRRSDVRIVDKATIPHYLQEYLGGIEREYGDELFIVDITSDVGIPCFCVAFSEYNAPIVPKGYGASLCAAYALERALLESLQPVHLRNEKLNAVERNTVDRLGRYPVLQRAAIADINDIIKYGNYSVIDFRNIADLYHGQDLAAQRHRILSQLTECNMSAYYHRVQDVEGYSLTKVLLSGSSQLCFLQVGKLILPNIRHLDERVGQRTEPGRRFSRESPPPTGSAIHGRTTS